MTGDIPLWILVGLAVLAAVGAIGKIWIKSYVERSAQVLVERNLESFKSELRQYEASLNSLQSSILSGHASRNALVDKRRMEAAETIWKDVIRLRGGSVAVFMMQILKLSEVGKRAIQEPKMREFLEVAKGSLELRDIANIEADAAQIFVGPFLWSRYIALRTIYLYSVAIIDGMAKGIENMSELMESTSKLNQMVEEVPPHQSEYLKQYPNNGAYFLIQQLSDATLQAARDELEGVQADAAAVKNAHRVMNLVGEMDKERQQSQVG